MVITMHGDEGLTVHFSEPEMQPSEGSSKRHRWQVRTLATGPWHREQSRRSQELFQAHPGPALPIPQTLALLTLPHRKAHRDQHTYKHTDPHCGILGVRSNSHGVPKPHLPGGHTPLIFRGRMGLTGSLSRGCCGCRGAFLPEAGS